MATPEGSRPDYVGPDWTLPPQGYAFLGPSPDEPAIRDPALASDEWSRLLGVFHCAREGRFDQVALLPELVRNGTDPHLRLAALRLLGDACRSDLCAAIAEFFTDPDASIRLASYAAAACTGKLSLARLLARHGFELRRGIERDLLADALTEMLDDAPELSVEPAEYEPYASAVMEKIRRLEPIIGHDGSALFGSSMDIRALVARILAFAEKADPEQYIDLTEHYVLRFESMTGAPVSDWFDQDETLNLQKVSRAMHDFQHELQSGHFISGKRYFFGLLIDT